MTDDRAVRDVERIDLSRAEDPRDVVHRAVAALAQGERLFLAGDGLSGVLANALSPEGITPPIGADQPDVPTVLIRGADELSDWVPRPSLLADRLARRGWPGPLTLVFPPPAEDSLFHRLPPAARQGPAEPRGVALRLPESWFARDVVRLVPVPVVLWPAGDGDADDPTSAAVRAGCRLVIESAAAPERALPTVVLVDGERHEVLRPGPVDEAALARLAATTILFVCTGNTCRSPMAEALCKVLIAERVGCAPSELEARGYLVSSAGVAAIQGMPAAANAVDVVHDRGGTLLGHASRRVTLELVRHADHIIAMTNDHLETLLQHVPEAAPRARLLHPEGLDVADPVGADRATYRHTAREIEAYLGPFLDAIGL